jgi:hypothetical protein
MEKVVTIEYFSLEEEKGKSNSIPHETSLSLRLLASGTQGS